jgi:cytochrome P450
VPGRRDFPLGASIALQQLEEEPHPHLAELREREPVSWLPVLSGWLVTRHDLALAVMRDTATFTVDDPRFSTARVIGPSMLSLDGDEHHRQRTPFVAPFRPRAVHDRFAAVVAQRAEQLIDSLLPTGGAELRRAFAGPLAASTVASILGLEESETPLVLAWYDAIVRAVTNITAGAGVPVEAEEAFAELRARLNASIEAPARTSLLAAIAAHSSLTRAQIVSNAAVLLFGGIETTEGMIANAILHLLERPAQVAQVRGQPQLLDAVVEESLRLEPAAAVVDRYATADVRLDRADIRCAELVRVSIAGANRDPAVFTEPDRFDLGRPTRRHVAFAQGPHVCLGVHLARLEARTALARLLGRLPALRLDPERPARIRGLVFRKPAELNVIWS